MFLNIWVCIEGAHSHHRLHTLRGNSCHGTSFHCLSNCYKTKIHNPNVRNGYLQHFLSLCYHHQALQQLQQLSASLQNSDLTNSVIDRIDATLV